MLQIFRDGRPVSMASFLPVQYLCNGAYVDARAANGVATLPEYRGQKLAEQILRFAEENIVVPLILSPAEESLIRYYENLGFKNAFQGERKM